MQEPLITKALPLDLWTVWTPQVDGHHCGCMQKPKRW